MPHDLNGQLVQPGDTVSMLFTVKAVHEDPDYCNADLESVHGLPGNGMKAVLSMVNTKMVEKV